MKVRRFWVAVPLILALMLGAVPASAAAVQMSVSPHNAKAAGTVTVRAQHLTPHGNYFLLLVPDKSKKLQRLMAAETANGRGAFSAKVRLPAVPYCGSAHVYLLSTKKALVKVAIKVTGCHPNVKAPPPPPHR